MRRWAIFFRVGRVGLLLGRLAGGCGLLAVALAFGVGCCCWTVAGAVAVAGAVWAFCGLAFGCLAVADWLLGFVSRLAVAVGWIGW